MSHIKKALHNGWLILEATRVLAHGKNDNGRGYILTLSNPSGSLQRAYFLRASTETEALLASEHVPMAA